MGKRENEKVIDELRSVKENSSIVKWDNQDNLSLFIIFFKKRFCAHKNTIENQLTKQKQANTKQQRQQFLRTYKRMCFCSREVFS